MSFHSIEHDLTFANDYYLIVRLSGTVEWSGYSFLFSLHFLLLLPQFYSLFSLLDLDLCMLLICANVITEMNDLPLISSK